MLQRRTPTNEESFIMSIQIDSIQKNFGGAPVLKDISLTIGTGEMAALLGP